MVAVVTVILAAAYVLVSLERAFHGRVRGTVAAAVQDLRPREAVPAAIIGVLIITLGFFPGPVLDYSSASVDDLVHRLDSSTTASTEN
jgi:NADH-quinone oxidoreductase subunit M